MESAFEAPLVASDPSLVVSVVVVVEPSDATRDEAGLLPQPAAVTARPARTMRMRMRDMVRTPLQAGAVRAYPEVAPHRLRRGNGSCYLPVTARRSCLGRGGTVAAP